MQPMMSPSSSKWRKYQRLTYTERDITLLYTLFIKKYMETGQIHNLFWGETRGSLKACQRRLRQLVAQRVIRRIKQAVVPGTGSKPDIFALDANAIPLLVYERGINPKLIDLRPWVDEENNRQMKHILATTDVQIAWHRACQAASITLETWIDERELRVQYGKEASTFIDEAGKSIKKPIADACIILNREGKRGYFWLEIDRASIDVSLSVFERPSIVGKVVRFLAWQTSEAYREELGNRPLRVLFVTRGNRRMSNMMQATEQIIRQMVHDRHDVPDTHIEAEIARLAGRFFFTTFEHLYAHNVLTEPIWYIPTREAPRALLE